MQAQHTCIYMYLLMNSMLMDLSCSALCRSARMSVSAAFSTLKLLHSDSSHIVFNRPKSYLEENNIARKKGGGGNLM